MTSCPVIVLLSLLATNGVVTGSTSPLQRPLRRPLEGEGRNGLALALQREKYQFGAIGCNFSDSVCDLSLESCFNDRAFGKCVPVYRNPTVEDSFRYNLNRDDVHLLELAMEELFQKGFRWGHSYTQCILQNYLQTIRERIPPGDFNCIEDPLEDEEGDIKGQVAPDLAFLQRPDSHRLKLPDYPPPPASPALEEATEADLVENAIANALLEDYLNSELDGGAREDSEWEDSAIGGGASLQPKIFAPTYNTPEKFRRGLETKDGDLAFLNDPPRMSPDLNSPSVELQLSDQELAQVANVMTEIAEAAKAEELENEVAEEIDAVLAQRAAGNGALEEDGQGSFLDGDEEDGDSVYSEGGLVFLKNPKRFLYEGRRDDDEEEFELGLSPDLRPSGFERRERLDVKKPGPWYRTVNNFAFDKRRQQEVKLKPEGRLFHFNPEFGGIGPADMKIQERDTSGQEMKMKTDTNKVSAPGAGSDGSSDEVNQLVNLIKKAGSSAEASKLAQQVPGNPLEIIDTSYVTIQLGKKIGSWTLAHDLVTLLADFMDIKHSTFQKIRIQDEKTITFKVASNKKGLTASDVAKGIEDLKADLEKEVDVSIVTAVAGVKASNPSGSESEEDAADDGGGEYGPDSPSSAPLIIGDGIRNKGLYIGVFAVCGVVAAALVASFFIFIIRRSTKSREKLTKMSQDDPAMESCKDYQELCRARMASKSNEKAEPIRAVQRVQSNASEGGTSSSRSSTSSWSEEPVLTNMDISTGHMVLSYMEDHLKKKDRLDQEWAALCTYEADPGSTSIGEKAENQKKNRYSNSLPYDHSRVILNDLANISGADYINASTITDHDPRNPAYIATQGPLPNTAADFWQLVWEQGSVVIVTLTRLAENGNTLCHRYWPEEGSELHHIYEVHLVSEHIWCDEYLVRSFYLKNLKTGETRTVTQFHFLAWPENGIPTSAKSLLEFRRKVNKSYRGRSCPIIVHCSDGAGRTGTYTLIDMVLNRMTKGAKEIDIAASLEHIRDQRPGMVRTKQQFEFVLMAVAEEVHAILKALPQ